MKLSDFINSYLKAALWSSTDEYGQYLDDNYELSDISHEFYNQAKRDCVRFLSDLKKILSNDEHEKLDYESLGYDFWLTRNHHGSGFWDGDYEDYISEILMKICKKYKEVELYVGDDEKIYCF